MSSNIAIIGAASAKGQDYIQAILDKPDNVNIVAIVINKTMPRKVEEWAEKYKWKVIRDGNVQELINSSYAGIQKTRYAGSPTAAGWAKIKINTVAFPATFPPPSLPILPP